MYRPTKLCRICSTRFRPTSKARTLCNECIRKVCIQGHRNRSRKEGSDIVLTQKEKFQAIKFLVMLNEVIDSHSWLKPNVDMKLLQEVYGLVSERKLIVID